VKKNDTHSRSRIAGNTAISRRTFTRGLLAAGLTAAIKPLVPAVAATSGAMTKFDYIVVGAGAGGGPVAARLANAGYTVALLEAGLDPTAAQAIDPLSGLIYQVPSLAGVAAEDPVLSWDFYVKHYGDLTQQKRDSKYVKDKGILYPRGSTLGGSTAHDAMVFAYAHDQDWDDIADATGDESWRARHMRKIFERLEDCEYCQPNAPGHGFKGYIPASRFDPQILELYPVLKDLAGAGKTVPSSFFHGNTTLDVNHPLVAKGDTGTFITPMHVAAPADVAPRVRVSIREHLLATAAAHPDKLFLITGALATKILTRHERAIGVEFLQQDVGKQGGGLYEADKLYNPSAQAQTKKIYAKREVILSAGVYNTPQLLKLSGIGPAQELRSFGIDVVADLPGVGRNLQDRIEITVNTALSDEIELYTRCRPFQQTPPDPCFVAWSAGQWAGAQPPFYGPYANNALYTSRISKSSSTHTLPDLFIAGQATAFHGFFPGFSNMTLGKTWTWLILKVHTRNTAGTVTLRSTDPRKMPEINFHYFDEGTDQKGEDLEAAVEAIKLARSFNQEAEAKQHVASELFPGSGIQTDDQLRQWIKDEAWGHHAGCTAKIGARHDSMAVLDSRFRVRDVHGLRVVDACAFPKVPGFFPVASIMMLGEKAGDVILEDARDDDHDHDHG
jgi:choline dehydrogenase